MDYAGIAYTHQCPRTRRKEVLYTLVQEDLFPTIVEALLRILVLFALEDGCKRSNMLQTSQRQRAYQVEIRSNTHLGVAQEDLGLAIPLLDRAWPPQLSVSPTPITKRG